MSKVNKVKMLKNTVSSLDINKLYKLQEYVIVSEEFFKELENYINEYLSRSDEGSDYDFIKKVIYLYDSMKDKLKVK